MLPPKLVWDSKITDALSRANLLLGELTLEEKRSPVSHLLAKHFMTKEAFITNKLDETSQTPEDLRLVHNYTKALDHGLSSLQNGPFTVKSNAWKPSKNF